MATEHIPGTPADAPMRDAPAEVKPLPAPERPSGPQEAPDLVFRIAERQPGPKPEQ